MKTLRYSDFLAIWWYMYVLIDWEGGPEGKMFGSSRSWRTERTQRGLCFTTGSQILSRPAGPNPVIIHFIFLFAFSSVTRLFKALLTPSRTALRRRFLSKVVSKSQFKRMFIRPHLLFKFEYAQLYTYTREYQLISSRHIIYSYRCTYIFYRFPQVTVISTFKGYFAFWHRKSIETL